MSTDTSCKDALDKIIKKSRVHLYKPIQIAEILYYHRKNSNFNLTDLESYRNLSKKWRDEVSMLLVGRKSTSSQKFQDNLFEKNALPPHLISQLGDINKSTNGAVEKYIYLALKKRMTTLSLVERYIDETEIKDFSLEELVDKFESSPGLKRSVDKIYEIIVYALFSTIVRALNLVVTVKVANSNSTIMKDFEPFITEVIGLTPDLHEITYPANIYRVGVTNAADRGLDMWTNFGPIVQVKHLTLTPQMVEDIALDLKADQIVVVCLDSEKESISNLLEQVGWSDKIQSIVPLSLLNTWYKTCLNDHYYSTLGKSLLEDIKREFSEEFPSTTELAPFIEKRGYAQIPLKNEWADIA